MYRIILRWAINTVAMWVAVSFVPGIHIQAQRGWWLTILGLALIFGLVNAILRPIIEMLTCPLIILTLGLGTLLINTLLFWLTGLIGAKFGIGFTVDGFWPAFFGALVITIVSVVLTLVIRDERRAARRARATR